MIIRGDVPAAPVYRAKNRTATGAKDGAFFDHDTALPFLSWHVVMPVMEDASAW